MWVPFLFYFYGNKWCIALCLIKVRKSKWHKKYILDPLITKGTSNPSTPRKIIHYVRSLNNVTPRFSYNLLTYTHLTYGGLWINPNSKDLFTNRQQLWLFSHKPESGEHTTFCYKASHHTLGDQIQVLNKYKSNLVFESKYRNLIFSFSVQFKYNNLQMLRNLLQRYENLCRKGFKVLD
jgi:hypothetical protein